MIRGNTSDFIDHTLPKDSVSAHGASHHTWAPPSESGAADGRVQVNFIERHV